MYVWFRKEEEASNGPENDEDVDVGKNFWTK